MMPKHSYCNHFVGKRKYFRKKVQKMGNVIGVVAEYNPFHNGHARSSSKRERA